LSNQIKVLNNFVMHKIHLYSVLCTRGFIIVILAFKLQSGAELDFKKLVYFYIIPFALVVYG
jgi:hypothetical protein